MKSPLEDPHNFGAILRSSAAFAVDGIIITKKNQVQVNSTVIKVSSGGIAYVPVCNVDSLEGAIDELRKKQYKIVSTVCEISSAASYNNLVLDSDMAIIFGNEHRGISQKLVKKSNFLCTIPVNSNISSLNVSVSAAIILANLTLSKAQTK